MFLLVTVALIYVLGLLVVSNHTIKDSGYLFSYFSPGVVIFCIKDGAKDMVVNSIRLVETVSLWSLFANRSCVIATLSLDAYHLTSAL